MNFPWYILWPGLVIGVIGGYALREWAYRGRRK